MKDRVNILEIKSTGNYNPLLFDQPRRIIAKVNGVVCDYTSKITPSLQLDLQWYGIYKSNDEMLDMIKEEAEQWFHDNIKKIRKEKIQKINKI